MKKQTLRTIAGSVPLALGFLLAGCAGGGNVATGSALTAAASGRAQITITWPARTATATRLIPVAANSVLVQFLSTDGTNTVVTSKLLVRPVTANGAAIPSTASFTDIPQGGLNVKATAYPSADGTGVGQATATAPITIVSGQTTPIGLTLASTIKTVIIYPLQITLTGQPVTLNTVAYDASNNVVLTSAFQWKNTDPTVITLVASGDTATVNAVGPGSSTVTVTETESGVAATKVLNVGAL